MKRRTHFVEGRHYQIDPDTGCWNWLMRVDRKGYGLCGKTKTSDARAHRESWRLVNGPIPDGHVMDHLCRNHGCINPEHLEAVTHAENVRRGDGAKITMAVAAVIRERVRAGDSLTQIARDYNVSLHVPFLVAEDRGWREDPSAPRQPIKPVFDCPNCGARIVGQRNKRFCDRRCRANFNSRARYRLKSAEFRKERPDA